MTAATPIREVARRVEGCLGDNRARDVLDLMEELGIFFMPLVDDFSAGRVRGAVTRSDLANLVGRFGDDARVIQARPVMLPNVPAHLPLGQLPTVAGPAPAFIVTERGGRLVGIYEPDVRGLRDPAGFAAERLEYHDVAP